MGDTAAQDRITQQCHRTRSHSSVALSVSALRVCQVQRNNNSLHKVHTVPREGKLGEWKASRCDVALCQCCLSSTKATRAAHCLVDLFPRSSVSLKKRQTSGMSKFPATNIEASTFRRASFYPAAAVSDSSDSCAVSDSSDSCAVSETRFQETLGDE